MQSTKTFTTRSNAKRNAIKAGVPAESVEVVAHGKGDGVRFGWRQVDTKVLADVFPAPAKAKPAKQKTKAKAQPAEREVRNGVKRPGAGGVCARVWDWLDQHKNSTVKDARAWAESEGLNLNNAAIEYYQWRRFNSKVA